MTTLNGQQPLTSNRPCSRCRCPLTFAPNVETGKTIPLDTRASIYAVFPGEDGRLIAWDINLLLRTAGELHLVTAGGSKRLDVRGVFVTHFATCPHAGQFSASARNQSEAKQ